MLYSNFAHDLISGNVSPARDTFYVMLVKDYKFSDEHSRKDVEVFEVAASGYVKGGKTSAVAVKKVGNNTTLQFTDVRWDISGSMIATGGVLYTGAGNLVMYLDFGKSVSCTDSTFTCHFATGLGIGVK